MKEKHAILEKVMNRWRNRKVNNFPPNSEEAIVSFEKSAGLVIPVDMKEYFIKLNGTEGEEGDDFFNF
jgi:hypothetical protein